jgi:tripeptide aminopeptidase
MPRSSPDRRAESLLMQLLALPGGSGNEGPVAAFIAAEISRASGGKAPLVDDGAHRRSPLRGEVGNLVLRLPGTVKGPRRLLSAHMDTVPICAGARPVKRGGRIVAADRSTGLGGDDRAGCAVLLATATSLLEQSLDHPPLTFLWTVQEEVGLLGARHASLAKLGRPAMGFNWDGALAHRVTLGATGGYRMEIAVEGLASHAGVHPEQGVSAIAASSLAVADLVRGGWHGLIEKGASRGTSNFGPIAGGLATNVVADRVDLAAEARSHDPKFRARIVREIENAFARAAREVRNVEGRTARATVDGRLDYEAFRLRPDEPCAQVAVAAVEAEGRAVDLAIANGGLDANWLTAHGVPTVTLGCGQNAIHTTGEWLDLAEFHAACRIARRIATGG